MSSSPFDDFNLGLHVGDEPSKVLAHRQQLSCLLPTDQPLQWFEQVHGDEVAIVTQHQNTPIIADAAVTQSPNVALAIMTADCLPILLTNKQGTEIAAIHAGWRPLASGIVEKTLAKMNAPAQQIYAWLGPCIGERAFEVGEEVRTQFCLLHPALESRFHLVGESKYLADLRSIAMFLLELLGVNNIDSLEHCTYQRNQEYFSYRRDRQTGRMASVIGLVKKI